MPPLNHTTDLKHTDSVYQVRVAEKNKQSHPNNAYERDRHLCASLEAAITAALSEHDESPTVRVMEIGPLVFYEPHDEDEEYLQTSIHERKVYDE